MDQQESEMNLQLRSVLAIGAHPDDLELGCAGTIALHKLRGDKVNVLVLTRGEVTGDPAVRERECRESAKVLGVDDVFIGGLADTKVGSGREAIDVIEATVNKVNPGIVYAPSSKDTHQDHRNAGHATLSACRRCRIILLYEGASTQREFIPQVFVDITKTLQLKLKATRVFGSQVNDGGIYAKATRATEGLARFRGFQAGVEVAEAFEVGKFIFEV